MGGPFIRDQGLVKPDEENKETYKQLFKVVLFLAFPVVVENISQTLLGVVDMYFVGKLGPAAIASVGITNMLMNVYIAIFFAVGIGTTAIVARSVGAKRYNLVGQAVQQSIIIGVILGIAAGTINLLFSKQILSLLGAEASVMKVVLPYFRIVSVPSIFLSLMIVISSALRGKGDTRTPMKIAIMANVINAILDYFLIFGIFGLPGFGVAGAAMATTISRMISAIFLLTIIKKDFGVEGSKWYRGFRYNASMFKSIMRVGAPAGMEKLFMRFGQLVYMGLIIKIGTEAYAAHSVGGTIETLAYVPAMGFTVAASTLVGQNLGAERPDLAFKYGMAAYLMGGGLMGIMGIVFYFFGGFLASIFTDNLVIIELLGRAFKIMGPFEVFVAMTLIITGALQGAGDTRFPMMITFVGIWIFRVLGIYILAIRMDMGLIGAWIAIVIDLVVRGSILMIRFLRGKWKHIKVLGE